MRNRKESAKSLKANLDPKSDPKPAQMLIVRSGMILTPAELKEELEQRRGY